MAEKSIEGNGFQGLRPKEQMEIAAQINAATPSSDLPTKQANKAGSPREGHSKKPPPAQQPAAAPKADLELTTSNTSLKFRIYGHNKIAVQIVDKETGDTIREIPSEELRQLAAQMDRMAGNFLDEMA